MCLCATLSSLAHLASLDGDTTTAVAFHERARKIQVAALGSWHPDLAETLLGLVEVWLERRDRDAAVPHAEHALQIRERVGDFGGLAEAQFALALALWAACRERRRALALAAAASAGYRGVDDAALAKVELWRRAHRLRR